MPETRPSAAEVQIAPAAALMADKARATMLIALLDGRPLAASELARLAAVSAPTASAHLAKLLEGGMVSVIRQGRHRYYRLSGYEVATAIEALSQLAPPAPVRSLRQSRQAVALAEARTCYDHLAGRAGVLLLDALLREGLLTEASNGATSNGATSGATSNGAIPAEATSQPSLTTGLAADMSTVRFTVTERGMARLQPFGINLDEVRSSRRRFAGACLDWTQRRPHLGGSLAAAITARLFELGWIERGPRLRNVRVTPAGRDGLAGTFGWTDTADEAGDAGPQQAAGLASPRARTGEPA
jgi:DNA-binding transcriptional ArsR family regulator